LDKLDSYKSQEVNGMIKYLIPFKRSGFAGGKNGDKHIYNYISVFAFINSDYIITAYPSDNSF